MVVASLLSACSLAPKTAMEPMPAPPSWKNVPAAAGWVSADAARAWSQGQWWLLFDDPVLHGLIERVELNNQNIKAAVANVAQAQALLRQQRADLFPQLGAQLGQQRSGGDNLTASNAASFNLNASWAPDLWGRVGDAVAAQSASVQLSQADLAGARLNAQASLAQAYFALREADAELALLGDIITGYERSARITQNRYDVGVAPRTDTFQAESTLRSAQASRVALQRDRAGYEHAIALLVGEAPAGFALTPAPWADAFPAVPAEVPSLLLLRRPDVASAERAVAAANLQIGVARSAWFPSLSLSANAGAGANRLNDLFSSPNLLWSLGVALAQTVFDGGARDARVDQAIAANAAAVARYRQVALTAMKEVEDQLSAQSTLAEQTVHVQAAAEVAARIEQQMLNRYQAGLTSYTDVVTAQASALSARRSLLQLQLQRQQAALSLIQALGGGWQTPWADVPGPG
ncbi:MAG: efflux transporter outer membrane subunit [Desulfovibrionaceae bacterium]|nr:efflux transporter outer membrane subunit [Desulfovibrionaceae bacterium]